MIVLGNIHRIGDDIAAMQIFDPAHDQDDPAIYAAYCLAAINPAFAELVQPGDILVAGRNFGHGPGVDAAATALAALEIGAVICVSAAADVVAAGERYGVLMIISPEAVAAFQPGQRGRIDLERAIIKNLATGEQFAFTIDAHSLNRRIARTALLRQARQFVSDEGLEG